MRLFFLSLVLIFQAFTAISQTPATTEHVRQLLTSMGSDKIGLLLMNNLISSFKEQATGADSTFWAEFAKEINTDELLALIVPIYQRNFDDEDIAELIQFYKSPIGMKLKEKMPLITQESYKVGSEWGKEISDKVIQRLKEKGYIKN